MMITSIYTKPTFCTCLKLADVAIGCQRCHTLSVKFVLVGEVSDCQFLRSTRSLLFLFTAAGVLIETMTLGRIPDVKS